MLIIFLFSGDLCDLMCEWSDVKTWLLTNNHSQPGARAQMRRWINLECLDTCLDALHIDSRLMLGGPMDQRAEYER